jgi:hypothetical protein
MIVYKLAIERSTKRLETCQKFHQIPRSWLVRHRLIYLCEECILSSLPDISETKIFESISWMKLIENIFTSGCKHWTWAFYVSMWIADMFKGVQLFVLWVNGQLKNHFVFCVYLQVLLEKEKRKKLYSNDLYWKQSNCTKLFKPTKLKSKLAQT